jgi:NTE family protein
VEANYNENISFGPHTFSLALRLGQSGNGELPLFDQYALGGFLQLSGYRPGELLGQSVAFNRLSYYRQIDYFKNPFGKRLFIGASAESGRTSESFQSLSNGASKSAFGLFAGLDTLLGPLYLGYGQAKGRDRIFYFFLGQP